VQTENSWRETKKDTKTQNGYIRVIFGMLLLNKPEVSRFKLLV